MWLKKPRVVFSMQKRILLLPLIWGAFGIGEVLILGYLFGPIVNNIPFPQNDKPIGGSYLPALFFSFAAILAVLGLSLYSLGIWNIDLSDRKVKTDIAALGVMFASGILVFYYAIFLFPLAVALVYFLATNID
ncbi:hypothetical protein AUI46_06265 [archaeon 13_1_40CM_2_52_13]|nr:MAG: hypothetical protein AUI46_06265 [archaeon 13_1_40CM_2_52_13]